LTDANLKLNPKKCKFMCEEVEYLGHVVTAQGLKPNTRKLDAAREFTILSNCNNFWVLSHIIGDSSLTILELPTHCMSLHNRVYHLFGQLFVNRHSMS